MKCLVAITALLFFGCEAAPPPPAPAEPSLAASIAELNANYVACMRRENDRLRQEKLALDAKIAAKVVEAEDLAKTLSKTPKGRR